ncbi:hypothetical protein JVU11DRAFT_5256 [Chiua virens]|nr:hypothetical protein JVU11DRAFT_5256 [Chiua virens]
MMMDSIPLENARPFIVTETLAQLLTSLRQQCHIPAQQRYPPFQGSIAATSSRSKAQPPDPQTRIAAVVYDTDASFDIRRFRHLLLSRTARLQPTLDPQESVRRSLARLHLFRPTSLSQLAASIASLPAYHTSQMPNQEIAVLAIDSISSFYWPERFAAEQLRGFTRGKVHTAAVLPPLHHVLSAIQSVRRSHGPLAILTNWALNSAPSGSESLYKQHLSPFPVLDEGIADLGAKAITNPDHSSSSPLRLAHHITLSFPLSETISAPLDDALPHEVSHEKAIVGSRQICCLVRSAGNRDTVRFTIQITDDDILVQTTEVDAVISISFFIPISQS